MKHYTSSMPDDCLNSALSEKFRCHYVDATNLNTYCKTSNAFENVSNAMTLELTVY